MNRRTHSHPRFPRHHLQLLGFDHERFSVKYQGLDQRLTGVLPAKVINELIA